MSEPRKPDRSDATAQLRSEPDEAPRGSRLKPISGFLNSPFGLWFLSTIFISAGSWIFTEWRDSRQAHAERQERTARLDLEITNRFDHGDLDMLRHALTNRDTGEFRAEALAAVPAQVLLPPDRSRQLFPEYGNRGLRALLIELRTLLSGANATCLDRAILEQREFQSRWLANPPSPDQADAFRDDLARLHDRRWSLVARTTRLSADDEGFIESEAGAVGYCQAIEDRQAAQNRNGSSSAR